jgi:hypothetical protein
MTSDRMGRASAGRADLGRSFQKVLRDHLSQALDFTEIEA